MDGGIGQAKAGSDQEIQLYRTYLRRVHNAGREAGQFFGSGPEFRDLFRGKLVVGIDPRNIDLQFPPNGDVDGARVTFDEFAFGRGSWRDHLRPVANSPIYREVRDVLAGGDVRESASYDELRRKALSGRPATRYLIPLEDASRIDSYYDHVARLVDSIRTRGYRARGRYTLDDAGRLASKVANGGRPLLVEMSESEIGMAINGDGTMVRVGPGNHRFAIVHQLGIPYARVEARLFHVRWVRDAVGGRLNSGRSTLVDALRQHEIASPEKGVSEPHTSGAASAGVTNMESGE